MDKYKLLHDTPTSKAGDVFETTPESPYYWNKASQVTYEKRVVEQYNNYWFEKIVENVYPEGILEFLNEKTKYIHNVGDCPNYNDWVQCRLHYKNKITKVKNRNGEVFSIGDKAYALVGNKQTATCAITSFEIINNELFAFAEYFMTNIDSVIKSKNTTPPKTYTTEEILSAISYAENNYRQVSTVNESARGDIAIILIKKKLGIDGYYVSDYENTFKKDL